MDSKIVNQISNELRGEVEYKPFSKHYTNRQPGDYLIDGEIIYLVARDRSIRRIDRMLNNVPLRSN
jgi:hypothetical protein